MTDTSLLYVGWLAGMLSLGGLSACLARIGIGTTLQDWGHRFLLLNLLLIGAATVWLLLIGSSYWLWCGATLSGMILISVFDARGHHRSPGVAQHRPLLQGSM